jgi:hypothetical protein
MAVWKSLAIGPFIPTIKPFVLVMLIKPLWAPGLKLALDVKHCFKHECEENYTMSSVILLEVRCLVHNVLIAVYSDTAFFVKGDFYIIFSMSNQELLSSEMNIS